MATLVTPTKLSLERWCKLPRSGGLDIFMFSGYAWFTPNPQQFGIASSSVKGVGENDSEDQKTWVDYEVTDMLVGPHWIAVRGACPIVVPAGHSQNAPDEADSMGLYVSGIKEVNLVTPGNAGFTRIELKTTLSIRGGEYGELICLGYQVTAFGKLHADIGNEGTMLIG